MSAVASPTAAPPDGRLADWVEQFAEGWRAPVGADAFADHFCRVLDPEIRLVQPQIPTLVGHRAFRERFARPLFALIPDLHGDVQGWAGDGEVAYIQLELTGTLGGRPVSWSTVDRVTVRDGLAVERVAFFDASPLVKALLTRPRAWPRFLRARAGELAGRMRGRG